MLNMSSTIFNILNRTSSQSSSLSRWCWKFDLRGISSTSVPNVQELVLKGYTFAKLDFRRPAQTPQWGLWKVINCDPKWGQSHRKAIKHNDEVKPVAKINNPLDHHDYFNVRDLVTIKDMFINNVHYGHNVGCRNDYMKPYLFGSRNDIDIIDLDQTLPLFQDALNFTAHIAYRKGVILFVSRDKMTMPWVEKVAKQCGEYAHCRYWRPGLFTDSKNVFPHMTRLPDLCIFLRTQNSVFETHKGVIDSAKMLIPTVGMVDSNCDPRLVSYPVPANDDTFKSVMYYLKLFAETIKRAKLKRIEDGLED